jgi:hypothetical protein
MEQVIERCAGLDVHKATVAACVRVARAGRTRQQEVRTHSPVALHPPADPFRALPGNRPSVFQRHPSSNSMALIERSSLNVYGADINCSRQACATDFRG